MSKDQRIFSSRGIPEDSVTYYAVKEMPQPDLSVVYGEGRNEIAYWKLQEFLEAEFGKMPFTTKMIYDKVTSKLGLNYFDTTELVRHMRRLDLLEVSRIK